MLNGRRLDVGIPERSVPATPRLSLRCPDQPVAWGSLRKHTLTRQLSCSQRGVASPTADPPQMASALSHRARSYLGTASQSQPAGRRPHRAARPKRRASAGCQGPVPCSAAEGPWSCSRRRAAHRGRGSSSRTHYMHACGERVMVALTLGGPAQHSTPNLVLPEREKSCFLTHATAWENSTSRPISLSVDIAAGSHHGTAQM
jgi:hypothetical protein